MIEIAELYIWFETFTLYEKAKTAVLISHKFLNWFQWTVVRWHDWWFVEAHAIFIFHH